MTNKHYWDCECSHNYIHHKETQPSCPICGTTHTDQPDSRETELWNCLQLTAEWSEDRHEKINCPICEASEHIAYIIEHGKCDICIHEHVQN